jgi:hypothetical protein
VRPVTGSTAYYSLPQAQAVVDTFFNGQRVWPQEIYTNLNLQERPLVNTAWELILNQKDESANMDINLQSLTDIKLYILYTDFTSVSGQP